MDSEYRYLECSCSSPEHTVRFAKDDEFLYMTFFLSELPWYKRVVSGLKYIFGYKCSYGHFDEIVLGEEETKRLLSILGEASK